MGHRIRKESYGFTLMEIMVVVIILGVLSTFAIPKYTTTMEVFRSREGVQILIALLQAQLNADVDVGEGSVASYDMDYLDVVIPGSDSFNAPVLHHDGATTNVVVIDGNPYPVYAQITRDNNAYSLYIRSDGTILCDQQNPCQKMGYAPW